MQKLLLVCLGLIVDLVLSILIINPSAPNAKNSTNREINLMDYYIQRETPAVLGAVTFADILNDEATQSATPSAKTAKTATDSNKKPQSTIHKSSLTIAVLGDSMVDTLGVDLPHLKSALKEYFPDTSLHLYNMGVGASNIEYGITRVNNSYSYLGQTKSSVLAVNPDIIVVESFAYNHWSNNKSDLDRHWLAIAKIIETIKNESPQTKIVLAAAVAPYCPTYTDGSANLPENRKYEECQTVKAYLQNLVNFATSEKYPLADAYHASLDNNKEGNPKYINQGDHIHPSDAGKALFAQKAAEAISKL